MSFDLAESLAQLERTPVVLDALPRGTSAAWHDRDEGIDTLSARQVVGHQLLATWTVHDLNHLAQIARVMAKRYTDAVGPWRAYLSILNR